MNEDLVTTAIVCLIAGAVFSGTLVGIADHSYFQDKIKLERQMEKDACRDRFGQYMKEQNEKMCYTKDLRLVFCRDLNDIR